MREKTEHFIKATGPGDVLIQVIQGAMRGAADELARELIGYLLDAELDPVVLAEKINARGMTVDLAACLDFPSTLPDIGSPEPPERLAVGRGGSMVDPGMLDALYQAQEAAKIVEP